MSHTASCAQSSTASASPAWADRVRRHHTPAGADTGTALHAWPRTLVTALLGQHRHINIYRKGNGGNLQPREFS